MSPNRSVPPVGLRLTHVSDYFTEQESKHFDSASMNHSSELQRVQAVVILRCSYSSHVLRAPLYCWNRLMNILNVLCCTTGQSDQTVLCTLYSCCSWREDLSAAGLKVTKTEEKESACPDLTGKPFIHHN